MKEQKAQICTKELFINVRYKEIICSIVLFRNILKIKKPITKNIYNILHALHKILKINIYKKIKNVGLLSRLYQVWLIYSFFVKEIERAMQM